jgi:hypothetical protein
MKRRAIVLSLILAVDALAQGAAARGQSAVTAGHGVEVSPADRAAIEQLLAAYNQALSTCASMQYADLFTADGTFTSDDFRGAKHRQLYGKRATLVGRDKLVELVETEEFCRNPQERAAGAGTRAGVGASFSKLRLEPAVDGVHGSLPLGNGGRYEDLYVKTADGWKFRSRNVVMPAN